MKKLFSLILILLFVLFFINNTHQCTVTCMYPRVTNITLYCPEGLYGYYICYRYEEYFVFCEKPGYRVNTSNPDIMAWVVC